MFYFLNSYQYYRSKKIKCPCCKKTVKGLENVETLPLNLPLFSEIVKNDSSVKKYLDTQNSKNSFISKCEKHPSKQKHFFCSYHNTNLCRTCIKDYHSDTNCCIVDLYDIHKLFIINEDNCKKNEQVLQMKRRHIVQRKIKDDIECE